MGDALLLVSRNMTETVGTEELKSAVLTLHPQAAVEHLHHLFVAAGGDGSDGLIAVEAKEQTSRVQARATAAVGDAYGDLPGAMPEPVGGAVGSAMLGVRDGLDGLRDRFWEAMPRRHARAHEVTAVHSRAETRRRAAMGLLALVVVVLVVGVVLALVPRGADVREVGQVAGSDSRPGRCARCCQPCRQPRWARSPVRPWSTTARPGRRSSAPARPASVPPALDELEARVSSGLDGLYNAQRSAVERLASCPRTRSGLPRRRRPQAVLSTSTATTAPSTAPTSRPATWPRIVKDGDKASGGKAIDTPSQLAVADYVIIVDDKGRPFRWSPSNSAGAGTLAKINLRGRTGFEEGHGDIEAYDPPVGNYRIYVAEPSLNQIMKYTQDFDGSSFAAPAPWLSSPSSEVADIDQLYIDFDVYTLFNDTLRRYEFGKWDGNFALDELPDDGDLRPGHDYRMVDGSGSEGTLGRAYLYDAKHGRIVGFDKSDGSYIGQWWPANGGHADGRHARHVRHRGRPQQEADEAQERPARVGHARGHLQDDPRGRGRRGGAAVPGRRR